MNTNATQPAATETSCLVEIIELKWLMAGHGVRIHVEQLLHDSEYARHTLAQAAAMPNQALREAAQRLRACLCLPEA
jgi:hypothetical protein